MITPIVLVENQQLTGSAANYYTVPNVKNAFVRIDKATFTNHHTAAISIDAHVIITGEAAAADEDDANKIIDGKSIAPGETYSAHKELVGRILTQDQELSMLASTTAQVTVRIEGVLIT